MISVLRWCALLLVVLFWWMGAPPRPMPSVEPTPSEKVELGRHLFYDTRLSANQTQACSSCHFQALAFADSARTSIGSTGEKHARNAPALVNVAYAPTLTWHNPNLKTIEQQMAIPLFGSAPIELGLVNEALQNQALARLSTDARYRELFAAAFPNQVQPVTMSNTVLALASFVRALVSFDSAYDRAELSASAQRGLALFNSERLKCGQCHTGANFGARDATQFFNTGLYNIGGNGAYPSNNTGLMETTGKPADEGKFRVPSLRNVALTAPYMHDGTLRTLDEVLSAYSRGGRKIDAGEYAGDGALNPHKSKLVAGFVLSDAERADVISFLESLTDETVVNDKQFASPFEDR